MTEVTQIQRRYTVTIPKRIREEFGLREGAEVVWQVEGRRIILRPRTFKNLQGLYRGAPRYGRAEKLEIEKRMIQLAEREDRLDNSKGSLHGTASLRKEKRATRPRRA